MARIEIVREHERPGGWTFEVDIGGDLEDAAVRRVRLSLAWADYNLWSPDGGDAPERIAEAVLAFLLSKKGARDLRPAFDAAVARLLYPEADRAIPGLIRRAR